MVVEKVVQVQSTSQPLSPLEWCQDCRRDSGTSSVSVSLSMSVDNHSVEYLSSHNQSVSVTTAFHQRLETSLLPPSELPLTPFPSGAVATAVGVTVALLVLLLLFIIILAVVAIVMR